MQEISAKRDEVADELERFNIDIATLTEIKNKYKRSKNLGIHTLI